VRVLSPTLQTGLEIASGAPLLVDVEFGCGGAVYALAQGDFPPGNPPGSPALPDTGSLVEVNADGSLPAVVTNLNLPTSLEILGDTAYIVSLAGEISTIRLRSRCGVGHAQERPGQIDSR
jgi:hypothetical protein